MELDRIGGFGSSEIIRILQDFWQSTGCVGTDDRKGSKD